MSKRKGDYMVGYGKPPKATQFKPGQSGNPAGRSKGAHNLTNLVQEELSRSVPVTIDGRRQKQSKGRLLIRLQVDKALKGDARAFLAIIKLAERAGAFIAASEARPPVDDSEIPDEKYSEILDAYVEALVKERG